MKKLAFLFCIAALMMGLSSCDNRPNVLGAWQGNMRQNIPGQMKDMVVTLDFAKDGTVNATYLMNVTSPLPPTDSIVGPYEVSITSTASVAGTWEYVKGEDDDIAMTFNPTTLNVNIEPDAVVYKANLITDKQAPALEAIKPQLITLYKNELTDDLTRNAMHMVITDIEVKGSIMEFEQNDIDYVFHKM